MSFLCILFQLTSQNTNQDFFEEQLVKIADKYAPHLRRESDKYFSYFPM